MSINNLKLKQKLYPVIQEIKKNQTLFLFTHIFVR